MKKVLALIAAVLMASPAFAAVQNVKVSGDIDSSYVSRNHFNLGAKSNTNGNETGLSKQNFFTTQTRLKVDADLSDNVSATVRLLNESTWGSANRVSTTGTAQNSDLRVDQAYATLREFLYSPLTVSVGRQDFVFGNGFILGGNGPNNVAVNGGLNGIARDLSKDNTTNDGIKVILDYKPLTLTGIYYKNDQRVVVGNQQQPKTSSDVYGLNANYQLGDAMNTVAEGYLFARVNQSDYVAGATTDKRDKLYVPGLRLSTNPIKGLNVQAEAALQLGDAVVSPGTNEIAEKRSAFGYQLMANYSVPVLEKYKPTVSAAFTHVSGDKNATKVNDGAKSSKKYTAWDSFAEGQNGGTIYNSLFNLTNLNILALGASITPIEDVTTSFTWSNLMVDKKYYAGSNVLAFSQPDGQPVTPGTTGRSNLGNEYDANVNYAYTEDVTMGVSLGWFVPGRTFTSANNDVASQAIAHVNVNF